MFRRLQINGTIVRWALKLRPMPPQIGAELVDVGRC
jgi:hypothetical protein